MDCEAAMGLDQPGRRRRHQVGNIPHQHYPGRLPHLRSPSPSSSHLSRTPGEVQPARREDTPSFGGTAYPSTHGDGVGLTRPFATYLRCLRSCAFVEPTSTRTLQPRTNCSHPTRGEAAGRRMAWAGIIGAGPLQVGTRRLLWRHHDGPQQSRFSLRLQAAAASSATPIRRLASAPVLPAACQIPSLPRPLSRRGEKTRESVPTT